MYYGITVFSKQEVDLQRHMSWSYFMSNALRSEVIVRFVDII